MRQISAWWTKGLSHPLGQAGEGAGPQKAVGESESSARLSSWSSGSQFPSSGQRAVSHERCQVMQTSGKVARGLHPCHGIREVETVWPWNREKSLDKRWSSQWALGKWVRDWCWCLNAFCCVFPCCSGQSPGQTKLWLTAEGPVCPQQLCLLQWRWFPGQESGTEGIFSSYIVSCIENEQKVVERGLWTIWFIFLAVELSRS